MTAQANISEARQATLEEVTAELSRSTPHKTNKSDAFNALRRIIREVEQSNIEHDDLAAATIDLARLYAHFMPAQPKRPKTAFDWVAKAMSKKDARYYLNFVHVTPEKIQATDGHRLHIVPNVDGLEPGFYGAEGVRLHGPEYARFPDTERVQPSPNHCGRAWHSLKLADLKTGSRTTKDGVIHWYEFPTADDESPRRVHVNKSYVDQLASMDPSESLRVNAGGMGDSLLVELSGERIAVMMPLRQ